MRQQEDIVYPRAAPFVFMHLACVTAIWTGITPRALALCALLYAVRMFGITAGYHRYFSHRAFKTSRSFQFVLACLAQSSTQKGVLWWAAMHRHHHRHSDTDADIHSPRRHGLLYAHIGWVFATRNRTFDHGAVSDFVRFPELMFLQRLSMLPAVAAAVAAWLAAGWAGLIVGFAWSTVLLYHGTFAINSLAHACGRQRYDTRDDSRNSWWLAVITMGEGWHNNHHAVPGSARQGFRWYEVDATFYILTALSWVGLVWDLGAPRRAIAPADGRLKASFGRPIGASASARLGDAAGV